MILDIAKKIIIVSLNGKNTAKPITNVYLN